MTDPEGNSKAIRDLLAHGLNEAVEAAERIEEGLADQSGSEIFAGFQLLEEIGRGGMGIIYRARERLTKRIVALKTIAPKFVGVEGVRQRFEQEVCAAAALKHENILRIYEVGEWGGFPYFSMEFAERGSLMDHLADFARRDSREIARLLVKIAGGIQHAHDNRVIHLDLKPGNILLNAANEPLIADFGLAQLMLDNPASDVTTALVVLGTPGYIAPELAQGQSTVAADIYGLGAIFYHLLTGKRPFEGSTSLQSLTRAATAAPPRARQLRRDIPKPFETICDCCLQPEPDARYPSAEAFAAELERVLRGRFRRATRPRMKRRPLLMVIPALLLAAALGFGFWFWRTQHRPKPPPTTVHVKTDATYFANRALEILAREHSEPNLRTAEQLMRQALSAEPNTALIHAELSRILSKIYWHIGPDEAVSREALAEAERALALNPRLTISHLAMADYHFRCQRDYPAALVSLQRAGELNPNDGAVPALAALVLKRVDRWDEALASSRRACELEPESAPHHYDLAVTCDFLRRYPDALAASEKAKYLAPDNPAHRVLHAWLLFRAKGDTSGLEEIVATLPFAQQMDPQYFDAVFLWLLWSGRQAEALRLAEALPENYAVRRYDALLLKPFFVGVARRALGDESGAARAFETTREILEGRALKLPPEARVFGQLGIVYGYLGRFAEALRDGLRASDLLPLSREPVGGSYVAAQLAEIYTIVGEPDKAVAVIDDLLARPGYLTVHELKVDPRWNPLRNNARFQELVAVRAQN
jgi:serine/threonine protein kinase/Flp pilus assembly protein TadD